MSSVSLSSGEDFDGGGGIDGNNRNSLISYSVIFGTYFNGSRSNKLLKVPNKNVKRFGRRKHTNLMFCVALPVLLSVLFLFPGGCHGGKAKKNNGSKNGNFSHSPTNHEEVLSRTQDSISSSSSTPTNDDYWVGSHKLEFKPHPLLMPSTQTPTSQIPIPIIELGMAPTTTPSSSMGSSEGGGDGGETDDLAESASNTSEEERKGKGKTRKSRGGRKKSRDQRRMAHRTLWARQNAASNASSVHMVKALEQNPYFLHNHHQLQQNQQAPVILTSGSVMGYQNPLMIPPLNSRNDDSFHGSSTTWSINHPGNGIIAPNLISSGLSSHSTQQNSGQVTDSSSSQETSQQVQQPQFSPGRHIPQFQYGYPQFHLHHLQQQRLLASQIAAQQYQQSQQYPLQIPPLAQAQNSFSMSPSGPEHLKQQSGSAPVMVTGSNGPVLMYYGPSGVGTHSGLGQIPSASGPIKPFNINEVHGVGLPAHLQYNHITGPDISGAHTHNQQQNGVSGITSGTNPHYFRNNFLRSLMDKMATFGRFLPVPFVTKYSSPPPHTIQQHQPQLQQQGYSHFSRRMKK